MIGAGDYGTHLSSARLAAGLALAQAARAARAAEAAFLSAPAVQRASAREAFRASHARFCALRSEATEIEDALFPFPELAEDPDDGFGDDPPMG